MQGGITPSNQSSGLQFADWAHTNPPQLKAATQYFLKVTVQVRLSKIEQLNNM